jgi:hypothetical protein
MTGLSLDFSNLGPITLRLGAATGVGAAIGSIAISATTRPGCVPTPSWHSAPPPPC